VHLITLRCTALGERTALGGILTIYMGLGWGILRVESGGWVRERPQGPINADTRPLPGKPDRGSSQINGGGRSTSRSVVTLGDKFISRGREKKKGGTDDG